MVYPYVVLVVRCSSRTGTTCTILLFFYHLLFDRTNRYTIHNQGDADAAPKNDTFRHDRSTTKRKKSKIPPASYSCRFLFWLKMVGAGWLNSKGRLFDWLSTRSNFE